MGSSEATAAAPWRSAFLADLATMKPALLTLSTLHRQGGGEIAPRARTCVLRGMWASLPENEKNEAPRNPDRYESDLPTITTDIRMQKGLEIMGSGGGSEGGTRTGSGGGGLVEAVWWAQDAGVQWRVRGTAWVLGPDIDGDSEGAVAARKAITARMRKRAGSDADEDGDWSWAQEVTGQFGNMSPVSRGMFRHPPPGTPRAIPPGKGLGLGQKVTDLQDEIARANFRVVVILPTEVDQCDMSRPGDERRWLYTYLRTSEEAAHAGGEVIVGWEKVEVWP